MKSDRESQILYVIIYIRNLNGFPGDSLVKNPPDDAGDARDMGSIPGSDRSPGRGNGNPLQYFTGKIPWTEEPGGLQSMGLQKVRHD